MRHFDRELEGYFDFEDVYRDAVAHAEPGGILIELGVLEGKSLAFLAVEAHNSNKGLAVVGVDLFVNEWNPSGYRQRLRKLFDAHGFSLVRLIQSRSDLAADVFKDGSVSFVFIDADHSEEAVSKDIAAWRPKLRPGGVMAGHDYKDEFPGVAAAVGKAFEIVELLSVCSWRVRL